MAGFPYQSVTEFVRIIRGHLIREGWIHHVDGEGPSPDAADEDAYWDWYNERGKVKDKLIGKFLNWGTTLDLTRAGWNPTITSPRETYLRILA